MVIGVTGSFGSGKSTVARMFVSLGAQVLDADRIAHRLIRPGTRAYRNIIKTFGREILGPGRAIARKKIARVVFDNRQLLRKLNRIVHPQVIGLIRKEIKKTGRGIFILDAPLLIEAGLKKEVDALIVVRTTRKKQIERILKKRTCSKTQILKRINSQIALSKKIRLADFVIDNNGSLGNTLIQVKRIYRELKKQLMQTTQGA